MQQSLRGDGGDEPVGRPAERVQRGVGGAGSGDEPHGVGGAVDVPAGGSGRGRPRPAPGAGGRPSGAARRPPTAPAVAASAAAASSKATTSPPARSATCGQGPDEALDRGGGRRLRQGGGELGPVGHRDVVVVTGQRAVDAARAAGPACCPARTPSPPRSRPRRRSPSSSCAGSPRGRRARPPRRAPRSAWSRPVPGAGVTGTGARRLPIQCVCIGHRRTVSNAGEARQALSRRGGAVGPLRCRACS